MESKTDINGIYKDMDTGGLINKDNKALQGYKERKRQQFRMNKMEREIKEIKSDVHSIKELLEKLITLNNTGS